MPSSVTPFLHRASASGSACSGHSHKDITERTATVPGFLRSAGCSEAHPCCAWSGMLCCCPGSGLPRLHSCRWLQGTALLLCLMLPSWGGELRLEAAAEAVLPATLHGAEHTSLALLSLRMCTFQVPFPSCTWSGEGPFEQLSHRHWSSRCLDIQAPSVKVGVPGERAEAGKPFDKPPVVVEPLWARGSHQDEPESVEGSEWQGCSHQCHPGPCLMFQVPAPPEATTF